MQKQNAFDHLLPKTNMFVKTYSLADAYRHITAIKIAHATWYFQTYHKVK